MPHYCYRRVTIACIMPSLSGVKSQSREARLESVREDLDSSLMRGLDPSLRRSRFLKEV